MKIEKREKHREELPKTLSFIKILHCISLYFQFPNSQHLAASRNYHSPSYITSFFFFPFSSSTKNLIMVDKK